MFDGQIRTSRATALLPISKNSISISALISSANNSWLTIEFSPKIDRYRLNLVAVHEMFRWHHRPAAWARIYQAAAKVIEDCAVYDPGWTSMALAELSATLDPVLASLEVVQRKIDGAGNIPPAHITTAHLCDAYLDLFEGVLPSIARILVPLRSARSPKRKSAADLAQQETRKLIEQLASGQEWGSLLAPYDPGYRNGIAHRSITTERNGTVSISEDSGLIHHLTQGHLLELVNDAVTTADAFLAALEISPHRPQIEFELSSILAAEAVGLECAPLEQSIEGWNVNIPGTIEFNLRGPRCDEIKLLRAIASGCAVIKTKPKAIFIRFLNRAGEPRGSWIITSELLSAVDASVQSLEGMIRESKCYQLRLERPYQKV